MSLISTIVSSANRVIRELLEFFIIIIYITIIPAIFVLLVSYKIVTNTACVYDLIWIAIVIVAYGMQIDLLMQFEQWLGKKLGTW